MKIPRTPPSQVEILRDLIRDPERLARLLTVVDDPLIQGKYRHWDKVRHLTPPGDLTSREWWLGIKHRRLALSRKIPLRDRSGEPFTFALIDPLQEGLHQIDSLTRGTIEMPEAVTNQETRDTYMVRSLIEESITSSQIEGASTTRVIAREMIRQGREPRDRSERMIKNNYQTMQRIREVRDEPLTEDLLFEIHRIVTDGTLDDASGAGRFRTVDEDVRVVDDYGTTYHVPPLAAELDGRVETLCRFANADLDARPFIHPAIRSMILHFWIGYDHPFVDGNGRTARALFYWSMLRHKFWLFEFISISDIILKSYTGYARAFLYSETDGGDLTYFLDYHARVINRAISGLSTYIREKTEETRAIQSRLRGMDVLNARQRALVMHAIQHPGFRYSFGSHANSHAVVHQTARTDILDLVAKGLLVRVGSGRRHGFVPAVDLQRRLLAEP